MAYKAKNLLFGHLQKMFANPLASVIIVNTDSQCFIYLLTQIYR